MNKSSFIIFLDRAHGKDVPGKRSPDGKHIEWEWSERICKELAIVLRAVGFEVVETNPSDVEIGLSKRRSLIDGYKTSKTKIMLSMHNNAAGMGDKWMSARGLELWTRPGRDGADDLAQIIFDKAKIWFPDVRHRYGADRIGERDKEGNLAMVSSNKYLGVLVEWLFQDNKEDVAILLDEASNKRFIDMIVDAVEEFAEKNSK